MFKEEVIVGQCICNDRRWPETFRVMGLKGAEMVVLGYNTPSDNVYAPHEPPYLRVFHHNLSLQAAAYQNGIWVVATAKAGKEDGFWLHGGTAIVAPTGEIVAKGTTEQDEVISYDCDLALGEYIRNTTFNFAKHRRPEHYKLISERAGVKVETSN
jgi:predicted amidohydrolase